MNRLDDVAQAAFRWRLPEAASTCLLGMALLSAGMDKMLFFLAATIVGAATLRFRNRDNSGVGRLMLGSQALLGAAAVLGGAAVTGLGGILGWAGGYGILAALVLIPLGIGVVALGISLMTIVFARPKLQASASESAARSEEHRLPPVGMSKLSNPGIG